MKTPPVALQSRINPAPTTPPPPTMKATHAIDADAADARDYMRRLGQAARESAVVVAEAAAMDRNTVLAVLHLLVEFQSFPENTQQQV